MDDLYPTEIKTTESEFKKVFHIVEPFISGKRGYDMGCGGFKIPGSMGIDVRIASHIDIRIDAADPLLWEKIGDVLPSDYISSSHLLEDFDMEDQIRICKMWMKRLKPGGLFINYVPESGAYKGCNLAHRHEYRRGDMEGLFQLLGLKVVLIYYESGWNENLYGILGIGRKEI